MTELRHTETNAGDDSTGRAFGLDGNLYLAVLLAVMGSLVIFAVLGLLLHLNYLLASLIASLPLTGVLVWALCLKKGKPAGYDRDILDHWRSRGNFTKNTSEQERILR